MPKALKYSVFTFLIIVALLIIIPFFIPLNSYKGLIVSKVKEATDRDLVINGDIKLRILPNIAITLQEVKLSSIAGTKEPSLVYIKEAKAALSLLPLITGKVEVAAIELQEPTINLEVLDNGQKNWEIAKVEKNNTTTGNEAVVTNNKTVELPVFVKYIRIVDGKLTYVADKEQKVFDNINLDTKINSIKGPIDFTLSVNGLEQKIIIEGNIGEFEKIIPLTSLINISGEKIEVAGKFDTKNGSFAGNASTKGNSKNFGVPVELQGDYELATLILADDKQIVIKDTKLNFKNIELLANTKYVIGHNNIQSNINLNPGNIVIDIISNVDKAAIFNGNVKVQAQAIAPLLAALSLKMDKLPPVANQKLILTTNLIYNPQEITLQNINFVAGNSNMQGMVKVKDMQHNISIFHNLRINNTDSFMNLLGVNSSNNIGALQISGEVQKAKDVFQINDKVGVFGTDISVKGNVNLSGKIPSFILDLQATLINLDKIITPQAPTKNSSAQQANINAGGGNSIKNGVPWSNNIIDLSFLNSINGNISASINKLTQGSLVLDNLKMKINIENGKLNINSLTSNIYGGQLNVAGYVQANKDQEASFNIDLKNAHLRNIIPQNVKIKVTEGQLSLKADLKTHGSSSYKYVSNLGGKFSMGALNGKISGFDLNRVVDAVNNVKNAEGILKIINSSFAGGETSFNNLAINADIENGIVKLTECRLDASPAIANATGQVNLPQYMLDVNASVTIASLPSLGVKLYGYLNNPQHKLDFKALQTHLVKNVLNNVVKDLKKGDVKPENIIKNALGIGQKKSAEPQDNTPTDNQDNNDKANDPVNKLLQKGLKKLF